MSAWRHSLLLLLLLPPLLCGACEDRPIFGIRALPDAGPPDGPLPDLAPIPDGLPEADTTCATYTAGVGLDPLDLVVALDTSASMDYLGKWRAVREAIKSFVSVPSFAGLGLGLQYFPARAECSVSAYAAPAIPIGVLPGVGTAIADSLDGQRMYGGTPMVPMLQGVMGYAQTWAAAHPRRTVVVLVATDGIPDESCLSPAPGALPNTLANVISVAGDAAAADPPIRTFVIGVGNELTALNQIAQAGGSGSALLLDPTKNIEQAFLEALDAVRLRAVSCEYEIPKPATGKLDYNKVNVLFTAEGDGETFFRVDGAADCDRSPTNAWYYDDPLSPARILLCDEACTRVKRAVDAKVEVQFGCKTTLL